MHSSTVPLIFRAFPCWVFRAFPCWVFRAFPCWVFSSFSLLIFICRGYSWDGEVTPLRLRHPDSIFVQCRGIGIWHSPGCLLTGCTIGGKLAGQLPPPRQTPDFMVFTAFPCWVFSSFSSLGFFKLFLADVPGLSLEWGSDPASPLAARPFLPTVPGVRDWLPPGCLLTGCTNGGKPTGQLSPLRHPGLYDFYSFPCWVFRAFHCWVFSSFSLLMCRGCLWDGKVTPLHLRHPDSFFLQYRELGTSSPPAACCPVALLEASWQANFHLPATPDLFVIFDYLQLL